MLKMDFTRQIVMGINTRYIRPNMRSCDRAQDLAVTGRRFGVDSSIYKPYYSSYSVKGGFTMTTIDIDFEVFKELTVRRCSEEMTENEVIRELLGLKTASQRKKTPDPGLGGTAWVTKGVTFPHGTEFRTRYKGKEYGGRTDNGAMVVNGKRHGSPSAAAIAITGSPVNGWRFWECKFPGSSQWRLLANLRQ